MCATPRPPWCTTLHAVPLDLLVSSVLGLVALLECRSDRAQNVQHRPSKRSGPRPAAIDQCSPRSNCSPAERCQPCRSAGDSPRASFRHPRLSFGAIWKHEPVLGLHWSEVVRVRFWRDAEVDLIVLGGSLVAGGVALVAVTSGWAGLVARRAMCRRNTAERLWPCLFLAAGDLNVRGPFMSLLLLLLV